MAEAGPGTVPTVAQALELWARTRAGEIAYEFVAEDGDCLALSYGELAARCGAVADRLVAAGLRSSRRPVVVCHRPGLDYVVAILGCLAAGVPVIPAYPPELLHRDIGLRRLAHIVADARPAAVLADPHVADGLELHDEGPGLPAGAAILQYTSGSTGSARGVVVTTGNIADNAAAIASTFGLTSDTRAVIWLPPYHDMGLMTGILLPLLAGHRVRLMSPLHFLKDPVSWLRQISHTSATFSGGPNFSLDLCLRRVTDAEVAELDLAGWSTAFTGAEPVRADTLAAFATRFAPAGFRPAAFAPSYGLAEATLLVSSGRWPGAAGDPAVGCGTPAAGHTVLVVDPATSRPVPPGAVGEIWVRGPSVTPGYWSGGELHEHPWGRVDGRAHLRTGDLGCLRDGELVVRGRRADVIIRNGANHHPEDLEDAALRGTHPFRSVCAAFEADGAVRSRVCLAVESRTAPGAAAVAAVRARVAARTGLRPDVLIVLPPGTIPRTSSGKISRTECREAFESGSWDFFTVPSEPAADGPDGPGGPDGADGADGADGPDGADAVDDSEAAAVERRLAAVIAEVFADVCRAPAAEPDTALFDLGGDSVSAGEIAAVLERRLAAPVPVDRVLELATPAALAAHLVQARRPGREPADG
jgi:acyl-CoA synthetase (AMP-forming)/AMP-acid ligase II/acyl carrier protein